MLAATQASTIGVPEVANGPTVAKTTLACFAISSRDAGSSRSAVRMGTSCAKPESASTFSLAMLVVFFSVHFFDALAIYFKVPGWDARSVKVMSALHAHAASHLQASL